VNKTSHAIRWLVIYQVDSVIQPLNNPGQELFPVQTTLEKIENGVFTSKAHEMISAHRTLRWRKKLQTQQSLHR